jgi:hypothetical protein
MALVDSLADVYENLRKPIAAVGIVIKSSASQLVTAAPTLTNGTGVPTAAEPNGSIYVDVAGTDGDDTLYLRIAGAWVAFQGQTT